jgi:predicted protein tyrosine phosphatase
MEEWQKQTIERKYPEIVSNKKIDYLNIADSYPYMHPVLIDLIKEKVGAWLLEKQGE